MWEMTTQHGSRCQRHKVVDYHVEPEEAWHTVTLNRYPLGTVCAECFDMMAKQARVRYSFVNITAASWSEQPPPRVPHRRKG